MNNLLRSQLLPYLCLGLLFAVSICFKLSYINIGAPYTTIDDNTLFNAGFLVWFGEAPPQRMYFESWIVGISAFFTYFLHLLQSDQLHQLSLNVIADAYRDFTSHPQDYVLHYRIVMLTFDLLTAWLVYAFAKLMINNSHKNWAAILATGLYLFSYNTIWCNLVARPDTMTAFFSVLGMWFYYKSNLSENKYYFYLSAIALGCATGFKLHAAFFVIAICADLIRIYSFIPAVKRIIPFGIISVFLFMVAAGSPLFDPLLYAKLRALNVKDDASPWLHWGDQFITLLKGTGWLIIPIILYGIFLHKKNTSNNTPANIRSLIFISVIFILLFSAIRQLRAYWMLPALPLFYMLASYYISNMKQKILVVSLTTALSLSFLAQSFLQISEFRQAKYSQLQEWVKTNVNPAEPIYIIGYDTLFLPRNSECLKNRKQIISNNLASAIEQGESFTYRHIRLWEERASLKLIDMLNTTSQEGFSYYGVNEAPLSELQKVIDLNTIKYLLVIPGYTPESEPEKIEQFKKHFTRITTVTAPGGKSGTGGLPYDIYARIN